MIRINLLPVKELQAEVTRRREMIIGCSVLGVSLLLLLGTHLFQSYQFTHREKELAALRTELQALNAKVKEIADLQVKIKDLRSKQKIIDDLNSKKSGPVLVMASLSQATPATLWLTELRENGGIITMNGLASDNETVATFMKSLAGSKYFTGVELIETTQGVKATEGLKKFALKARAIYRPKNTAPADSKNGAPAKIEGKRVERVTR